MYIYCYTTTKSHKKYIGQTVSKNLNRYKRNDVTRAIRGDKRKPHLYAAIALYGPDTFTITSLAEINCSDPTIAKKRLNYLEQFYIRLYGTQDKHKGYNIAAGGGGSFGYKRTVSKETRQKISEAGRGRKHSEETKLKMREAGRGKPKSPEHRAKLSAVRMGKKLGPFSPEHRRNMANAQLGKKHSSERVEKMRQSLLRHYETIREEREPWHS